jgi:hypothetical protein
MIRNALHYPGCFRRGNDISRGIQFHDNFPLIRHNDSRDFRFYERSLNESQIISDSVGHPRACDSVDRLLRLFTDTCDESANFDLRPANGNSAFADCFTNGLAYSYA